MKYILAGLILCAAKAGFAAPADEVRALVEAGKYDQAYTLGKAHPESLGEPAFDFYFGIAAIDTGHAGEGVLALERYLLNYPDNVSARLQLARGYFLLGEDARAREEFEGVRKLGPPAEVVATIDRYLDAIRLRESRYSRTGGAYVELGVGSDSNVNGGVANANITLPTLGPVVVAQTGQKQSDTFTTVGAGGYISNPIAPGVALFANAQGELKSNSSHANRAFDLGNYNAAGGISWLREKDLYRLSLADNLITLGSSRYRDALGVAAEWQHQLDELQSFNLGLQSARLNYFGNFTPYDADFLGASAGYRKLFSYAWQPILTLALNYGDETSRTQRDDLVRTLKGANAAVSFTPAAKWGVSAGYFYQQSDYKAPDLILGVTRHDRYEAWNGTLSYLYNRNLSFRVELLSARNHSNIALYEFPRDVIAFKVRYEFK